MKAQTIQTIIASTLLVAALVLLALALTLHRLTLDSVGVDSGDSAAPCPIMIGKSTGPCLPITIGTSGNTELYLGYVEILDHCVNQDELLDCAEFEHASKLDARDCDLAVESARLMCFLIGAPVSESVIVPQRR